MSRHRQTDQAFGSDSFLDIVANVVGILIILIVVVGVRVSRMPLPPASLPPPETESAAAAPVMIAADPAPASVPETVAAALAPAVAVPASPPAAIALAADPFVVEEPELPPAAPPQPQTIVIERPLPPLPAPEPSRELQQEADALQQSLAQLAVARDRILAELRRVAAETAAVEAQTTQLQAEARTRAQAAAEQEASERRELDAGERELAETLAQLAVLRTRLVEASEAAPEATVIQHRVSPLGKVVKGQELHFHLAAGRITPVPVDDLARQLTSQIERQKVMLSKLQTYEGEVGPVDGFRMKYIIERKRLSLAEELKYGQQVVRLAVSQWILIPEPGCPAETAEQALQRGSRFYQALLAAGPTATLTFWVYPDSFELNQTLKEFAHRHGYEVAARPLPFGVYITGSPDGSRSIAQ